MKASRAGLVGLILYGAASLAPVAWLGGARVYAWGTPGWSVYVAWAQGLALIYSVALASGVAATLVALWGAPPEGVALLSAAAAMPGLALSVRAFSPPGRLEALIGSAIVELDAHPSPGPGSFLILAGALAYAVATGLAAAEALASTRSVMISSGEK